MEYLGIILAKNDRISLCGCYIISILFSICLGGFMFNSFSDFNQIYNLLIAILYVNGFFMLGYRLIGFFYAS